jgi:arginase family protein
MSRLTCCVPRRKLRGTQQPRFDPAHAPGTGTPEAGGLTSRELLTAMSPRTPAAGQAD